MNKASNAAEINTCRHDAFIFSAGEIAIADEHESNRDDDQEHDDRAIFFDRFPR